MTITDDKSLSRSPDVKTALMGEAAAVLFDADTGKVRYLNETGLAVWRKLDGGKPISAVVKEMAEEFEADSLEEVRETVSAFAGEIESEGFAVPAPESGSLLLQPEPFPDLSDGPTHFDVSLTGKCNLACEYCFFANEMVGRSDLPKKEWLGFFAELGGLPTRTVCLSGGEPFVRRDLYELIDAAVANRMRFTMLSNGTLITEKTIRSLTEGKRGQRLDSIQVSIDGSRAEIHDASRGKGSFVKALRGLRLLMEARLPATVRVTVNRFNVEDLENTARLLLEEVGLPSFGTNDAMPMGAGCTNQASIALSPEERVVAMEKLAELAARYDGRIQAAAGPLANHRFFAEMEHARATGEKSADGRMGRLTACGCVFNKMDVLHDGAYVPCNMLPTLHLGRMNRDSVREIWKTHPTLAALKARRSIPMSEVEGCEGCEWQEYCNGSCPGLAFELTGDFNRANPHDCYRNFLRETGRG